MRNDAKRIDFIVASIKAILKDNMANHADWQRVNREIEWSIVDVPLTLMAFSVSFLS